MLMSCASFIDDLSVLSGCLPYRYHFRPAIEADFDTDAADPRSVVFGIRKGRMQRNGLLLLRSSGDVTELELEIEPLWQRTGPPLQVDLRVSDSQQRVVETRHTLDATTNRIRVELSPDSHLGLYQLEWLFSYSECERPSACFSARLHSARLLHGRD